MRLFSVLAAAAAFIGATSANAAATITFNGGMGMQPGEVLLASFDGGPSTYGGITGTYTILTGSSAGGADPFVDPRGDPYLSIQGGQSAVFGFGGLSQLGFDYGSADAYNTFVLTFLTGPDQILTGADIAAAANGNQTSPLTNGRVTFNAIGGNLITSLRLSSSQNSLEADNFAVIGAVPEPGTWAMMLVGFGAMGLGMRRRRAAGQIAQVA